jgi:hypothetical protein
MKLQKMLDKRLSEIKIFVLICTGLAFFFTNDSIAMMEAIDDQDLDATEFVSSGGKVFQEVDESIYQAEKRTFSSLVYRVGSTQGDVEEIKTYCAERIRHYSALAKDEVDSPYIEVSARWSKHQTKALADIAALRIFYQEADAKISSFETLLRGPLLPKGGALKKKSLDDTVNDIENLKAQKRQADALFHYFYPHYEISKVSWWNSLCRKIDRRIKEKIFYRLKPDFTIPDRSYGEDFFSVYNAIVPQNMQEARPTILINKAKNPKIKLAAVKSATDLYLGDDADNLSYERQYGSDGGDEYENDENA